MYFQSFVASLVSIIFIIIAAAPTVLAVMCMIKYLNNKK